MVGHLFEKDYCVEMEGCVPDGVKKHQTISAVHAICLIICLHLSGVVSNTMAAVMLLLLPVDDGHFVFVDGKQFQFVGKMWRSAV